MTWQQRHLVRNYIRDSLWIWPMFSLILALCAAQLVHYIEPAERSGADLHPDAARSLLDALASSVFTCIIFAGSFLLLAVQLASAQLTPRMIALVFKDPVTKLALSVFVFSFTFSLAVLIRISDVVPIRTTRLAAYSCMASLGLFLFMIDHVGRFLRPSGVLRAAARLGHRVIDQTFPRHLNGAPPAASSSARTPSLIGEPTSTVAAPSNGVILALDVPGLVSLAQRFDCTIVMVPQVGDFVTAGEPLFHVHGGKATGRPPTHVLTHSIAVGQERTFWQDPALAFRTIVDVASKALSPAINDPTTAVLAIDQIHHLLRHVGHRCLDEGEARDAAGRLRLVCRTPDWDDFVRLAVTEIRQFGGESIQVARRLRAMLENLIASLPRERTPPLIRELSLLDRTIRRSFAEPEDLALAEVSDLQGVGGHVEHDEKGSDGPAVEPPPPQPRART